MDDALLVRRLKRIGDLARDRRAPRRPRSALRDAVGQRRALDELHHEGADAVRLLEAVDGGDVRVIERGQDLGFALEPGEPIGVSGERRGKHLERDLALQIHVGRAIHLAHAALTDQGVHFIRADAAAR